MDNVHSKCNVVHEFVERATANINYQLDRLAECRSRGWSPETLQMIHLDNDARALEELAARVAQLRKFMIMEAA